MTNGIKLGNPAPLGLLAFGMTTGMLMYIDAGWVETEFEQFVASYALFYGGLCQILVAIFELIKGSSFSFAVFGSYGAFWLGWGMMVFQIHGADSTFVSTSEYPDGKSAWLISFGVLSLCFLSIALRKNICLIVTFGLLTTTFFTLGGAVHADNETAKTAAGYIGFLTAASAWYTGIAELVNEEYGRMVLPGLAPIIDPSRFKITKESMASRMNYDSKTNTLFLSFRSLQIRTRADISAIEESVKAAIKHANTPDNKVHVIVDYNDAYIGEDIFQEYWGMVDALQKEYYLSASRFYVTSFGSGLGGNQVAEAGLKLALAGGYDRKAKQSTIANDSSEV